MITNADAATRPAKWLVAHASLLPCSGEALDLACGKGRHAFWLGERGLRVLAVDRSAEAVGFVNAAAHRRGLPVRGEVQDLEVDEPAIELAAFDVIVGVHYLHRPLFPHLIAALRPGGVLVYETFTTEQATRGKPSSPAFLLQSGELHRLCASLDILAEREGDYDGRWVASIVARRPI